MIEMPTGPASYGRISAAAIFAALLAAPVFSIFALSTVVFAAVTANELATVNVPGVCFIGVSPTSVGFGSLQINSNAPANTQITDTDAYGNVNANILLYGSNWIGPGTANFLVSNTIWSETPQSSYTGTPLALAIQDTGVIVPGGGSNSVYFGLAIPPSTPGGSYTQNIVFENSC
jgi:hypothetical protein